jgi:hypothetical protein
MLTQLLTVKLRLNIDDFNVQYDTLLTNAINAVSARFDQETNRTLARTETSYEFGAHETEIIVAHYPIETVLNFELKTNETNGWAVQQNTEFLIRRKCVISLLVPLGTWRQQAKVDYIGGYVLPGATPDPGQTPLPDDLEQAAVEQVAYWFQNREALGLSRIWPHGGTYEQFSELDLLPSVAAVLRTHTRWTIC